MTNKIVQRPQVPLPAAQYVRTSNELQEYSIDNQKAVIKQYAANHGFVIVKTYADAGRSGIVAARRNALRDLLRDVVSGEAKFKVVLVYDVSRWGRFMDSDEAAHYEFVCSSSGIPLHYCAEPFLNDGAVSGSLMKALKRTMAAEFSRELSEKVFLGKTRLVRMGYWVGGPPGYGYRRLMVSSKGKPKRLLREGERKSLTTDRVILVPGCKEQVACVKRMFSMASEGRGCREIATELNRKGLQREGMQWTHTQVFRIVTHPKYAGWNVWYRNTQTLRSKKLRVRQADWISKVGAFAGIVDQETFDRAQRMLPRREDYLWSDQEIIDRFKHLLQTKGHLSESIAQKAHGMPVSSTVRRHFGSTRRLYAAIGYDVGLDEIAKTEQLERSTRLRRALFAEIANMFPGRVKISHLPRRTRSILRVDDSYFVSILLARQKRRFGRVHWVIEPCAAERDHITLVCKMNPHHDRVISCYLFPRLDGFRSHRSFKDDPWLRSGVELTSFSHFYEAVSQIAVLRPS